MKKLLSASSLLLVVTMLMGVVGVFPASATTINRWEAPEGVEKWYANDISDFDAPVIDGEISYYEYGYYTVRMYPEDRLTMAAESTGGQESVIDDQRRDQPASDWIDFYFAYDEDYIYIAIEDMGGTWEEGSATYEFIQNLVGEGQNVGTFATRNNYHFNTGFFLDDVTSYLSMQASSRGFDENKWFWSGSAQNGNADSRFGVPNSIVDDAYIKKSYVENGEVFADAPGGYRNVSSTDRGNVNQYRGQYRAVIELRYSKDKILGLMNELYYADLVELPNAMWFSFTGRTYAVKDEEVNGAGGLAHGGDVTGYNRYFHTDIRDSYVDYSEIGLMQGSSWQTIPNLIVFGDEDTEISMGTFESDLEPSLEYSSYYEDGTCVVTGLGDLYNETDIVIPEYAPDGSRVVGIYDGAFTNCYNIESVEIPASVQFIGDSAFYDCESLHTVSFAEGSELESINNYSFMFCSELENIELPDGITYIGYEAFYSCDDLDSINIPTSITEIGSWAFERCYYLDTVYYAGSRTQWNDVYKGSGWDYEMGYYTDDGTYTVDFLIEGALEFTSRGDGTCYVSGAGDFVDNTEIIIPEYSPDGDIVTTIASYVFYGYDNLQYVEIPASVTMIGDSAFYNCYSLHTVSFADDSQLELISSYAFKNCYDLEFICLPDGITYIGYEAFYYCDDLDSINIPTSITEIGSWAFEKCYYLDTVYYAGSRTQWNDVYKGSGWDYEMGSYTDDGTYTVDFLVEVGLEFTSRGDGTCYVSGAGDFVDEAEIIIPEYSPDGDIVTTIASYVFYGCDNLEYVEIPASVTMIGDSAFYNCYNLRTVSFADDSQLELISSYAFKNCYDLEFIWLPDSLTYIGWESFYACESLETINIPASVTYIESWAFERCYYLDVIYYDLTEFDWSVNVYKGSNWDYNVGAYTYDGDYIVVFVGEDPVTTAPDEWWTDDPVVTGTPNTGFETIPIVTLPVEWPTIDIGDIETAPPVEWPSSDEVSTAEPDEDEIISTEPTTAEPDEDDDNEDDDDDDEEETKKKKPAKTTEAETETEHVEKSVILFGCLETVSVAGLALVVSLGTCAVFVVKKKED